MLFYSPTTKGMQDNEWIERVRNGAKHRRRRSFFLGFWELLPWQIYNYLGWNQGLNTMHSNITGFGHVYDQNIQVLKIESK